MQVMYNEQKVTFLEKERERARKKLMEKLERYKGVGLLGNRLGSLQQEEENNEELKRRLDELTREIDDIRAKLAEQDSNKEDQSAPLSEEKLKMKVATTREKQQERLKEEAEKHLPLAQMEEEKRKEKERERALRRLEKYKGVGLLGQRLGSEEERTDDCLKKAQPKETQLEESQEACNPEKEKVLVLRSECCFVSERETLVPTYCEPDGIRNRFSQPTTNEPSVNNPSDDVANPEPSPKSDECKTEEPKADDTKSSFDNELAVIRKKQQEMYLARSTPQRRTTELIVCVPLCLPSCFFLFCYFLKLLFIF